MTFEMILMITGITLFGASSILAILALIRPGDSNERIILIPTIIASVVIAALLVVHGIRSGQIPTFGRFEALACYSLAVTAAYLHLSFRHPLQGISAIILPYITVILILGSKTIGMGYTNIAAEVKNTWLGLHIITAFIGYALFTLSSVLAIAYLIQDFNLKHKRFGTLFNKLPALETLDALMYAQIKFAFLIFTVSIIIGISLIKQTGGGAAEWIQDPKIAATLITWFFYAVLVHLRINSDKHGKKIAIVTIIGLACILFTFIGIHMVTDSVHNFILPDTAGGPK